MVTIAYVLAILLMVLLPLVLSFAMVRKYGTPWMVFGLGGLAFLVAEIARAPVSSWLTSADFFTTFSKATSPIYVIMIYAVIISLFQNVARYAGLRLAGPQSKPWGGAVAVAAGFAALNLVMIYGLNALMTLVYVISFPGTAPDGVAADQFAAMQQQVADFWNLSFFGSIVQSQLIPGLFQASLQIALTLMVWVGIGQKLWQWLVAAVALEIAQISVYSVVGNWILLYLADSQEYSINFFAGTFIFLALMAFNAGIAYLVYKKVKPLAPETAPVIVKPMPPSAKPVEKKLAPREKPVAELKPTKKLKNTDLK
jgi:uncharacterized membrane protein YhfC